MEEQRSRLDDLQRGHAQLEQALGYVQKTRLGATRCPTPPPESRDEKIQPPTPPRTPHRTPTGSPVEDEQSQSLRSQPRGNPSVGSRARKTPRSQSDPGEADRSLARSNSDSKVDDRYYDGLAVEKRAWPPYPEWQDLP